MKLLHSLFFLSVLWVPSALAQPPADWQRPADWIFQPKHHPVELKWKQRIESNLLWMIDRAEHPPGRQPNAPLVGVFADAGVWPLGAHSVVASLEASGFTIEPEVWYTATLEIVGDEALFRMGDHVAYAKAEQIRMPKNLISLTLGTTWHEIKRVRIWHAAPNPAWQTKKADTVKSRTPFAPVIHDYKNQ